MWKSKSIKTLSKVLWRRNKVTRQFLLPWPPCSSFVLRLLHWTTALHLYQLCTFSHALCTQLQLCFSSYAALPLLETPTTCCSTCGLGTAVLFSSPHDLLLAPFPTPAWPLLCVAMVSNVMCDAYLHIFLVPQPDLSKPILCSCTHPLACNRLVGDLRKTTASLPSLCLRLVAFTMC